MSDTPAAPPACDFYDHRLLDATSFFALQLTRLVDNLRQMAHRDGVQADVAFWTGLRQQASYLYAASALRLDPPSMDLQGYSINLITVELLPLVLRVTGKTLVQELVDAARSYMQVDIAHAIFLYFLPGQELEPHRSLEFYGIGPDACVEAVLLEQDVTLVNLGKP